jgi:hypothetical protein
MQKVDISNIVIPDVPDSFGRKNSLYMMSNNVIKETHQLIILKVIKKFNKKNI